MTLPPTSPALPTMKIQLYGGGGGATNSGYHPRGGGGGAAAGDGAAGEGGRGEDILLTIFPASPMIASEWRDGLMMVVQQQHGQRQVPPGRRHHHADPRMAGTGAGPSRTAATGDHDHIHHPSTVPASSSLDLLPITGNGGSSGGTMNPNRLLPPLSLTKETDKLIGLIGEYGLKIRLLNVRFDDDRHRQAIYDGARKIDAPPVPSREGLADEEFYYDVFGA